MAAAEDELRFQVQRCKGSGGSFRAIRIVVAADDVGTPGGGRHRVTIVRHVGEGLHLGIPAQDRRTGRSDQQYAVNAFMLLQRRRVMKPQQDCQRVRYDDPLAASELGELGSEKLVPVPQRWRIRLRQLRVEDLLATGPQRFGQLPLPVLLRSPVLPTVKHEKPAGAGCRHTAIMTVQPDSYETTMVPPMPLALSSATALHHW
jgi:hypothetical protein